MAIYSITDLAELSGIKAPTLRMWEQRYRVLQPKRTASNVRYYDDEDLRHLLNVALLNRNGYRISSIASLDKAVITEKVAELSEVSYEYANQLDALTLSMLEMDEQVFDRLLQANIDQLGFERTVMEVVLPFLEKVTMLWSAGSLAPVQEAFTAGLIRRKIVVAIDDLTRHHRWNGPSLVLFLPEGEGQEISLMLFHYLALSRGYRVYNLGRDISLRDLQDVCNIVKPQALFTIVNEAFAGDALAGYVKQLADMYARGIWLISGYQVVAQGIKSEGHVEVLPSMGDAIAYLDANSKSAAARTEAA